MITPATDRAMPSSATDGCSRVGAPEDLRAEHPDDVDHHDVEHHRARGGGADADRSARCVVAVVEPDEDDHGRHDHPLHDAVEQVGWVLEHPEDQEVAAAGDVADLL